MRLTDLLTLGDIAASLMGDTLRKLKMNRTELQVCWVLAERGEGRTRARSAQAMGQVARELCVPASRIANQLPNLVKRRFIAQVAQTPGNIDIDRRSRFYCLTQEGCKQVDKFLKEIALIEKTLYWATSKKTDEAITNYVAHLRCGMDADAFDSLEGLRAAMLDDSLSTKRRLQLPLSTLLNSLTGS